MDISTREKNIWIELSLNIVVSAYYFISVYNLSGWTEISGEEIGRIIGNVIVFAILGTIILHILFIRGTKEENKDERDKAIEAKGNAFAYYVLVVLCFFLIGHIMLNEGIKDIFPRREIPVTGPLIIHFIFFALLISTSIKSIVQIICYRKDY